MGTLSIMLGVFAMNGFNVIGVKALLCVLFLMLTSPVSGHVLSRAAHIAGVKKWDKTVCDHYEDDRKKGIIK
jgi:multicomponent Na+:H+ antiporter subunit G